MLGHDLIRADPSEQLELPLKHTPPWSAQDLGACSTRTCMDTYAYAYEHELARINCTPSRRSVTITVDCPATEAAPSTSRQHREYMHGTLLGNHLPWQAFPRTPRTTTIRPAFMHQQPTALTLEYDDRLRQVGIVHLNAIRTYFPIKCGFVFSS